MDIILKYGKKELKIDPSEVLCLADEEHFLEPERKRDCLEIARIAYADLNDLEGLADVHKVIAETYENELKEK